MDRFRWVLAFTVVGAAIAGCGGTTAGGSADPKANTETASPGSTNADEGGVETLPEHGGADLLPALPDAEEGAEGARPRPEPTITDLASAEAALNAGFYDRVGERIEALIRASRDGTALLLKARWLFEQGRYDEAAAAAEDASRHGGLRSKALAIAAEAKMARGKLDEAERILVGLAADPKALRAHLLLAQLLDRRGRGAEASRAYMKLIEAYNDGMIGTQDGEALAYVAAAAIGLDSPHDANDAFQQSTRVAPDRVETQLLWAQLFLSKYDTGNAAESLRHALKQNPEHPVALTLMARAQIDDHYGFAEAEKLLAKALRRNPNLAIAHVTLAGIALRDMDIAGADAHLAKALAVDPEDLQALSMNAAIRFLADDKPAFQRAKIAVLQRHRSYSELFNLVAEFADWEHRYPEIVGFAKEAVALNPSDAKAHATLGLNLLRMGEEEEGLAALRESWRRDRFNVRVYNTLNLYDDVIVNDYAVFDAPPFRFRMHKEERQLLQRYVPPVLNEAYRSMVRRYGMTPEGPLRFELYGANEHFSVRTAGLPNVGVQGVCFGKVVTAISPMGGPFNWGQITWHELAHVFHIQLSNNRVPRWFTEGLAEVEAEMGRPVWKRELDHRLYAFLVDGRLPRLRNLNRAFTRARSAEDVMVAYYASTHVIKHIIAAHGFDRIVAMLKLWAEGLSTEKVVERALGRSIDQLDDEFRAAQLRRMAKRDKDFSVDFHRYTDLEKFGKAASMAPKSPKAQAEHAAALLVRRKLDDAIAAAERALELAPHEPTARFVLARILAAKGDPQGAGKHLDALVAGRYDGYEIRLMRAQIASAGRDAAKVRAELEAATRIDEERAEAWVALIDLVGRDPAKKTEILERIASIEEHGSAPIRALLEAFLAQRRWDDILRYAERAIFVDPLNPETHRILSEAYLHARKGQEALFEADAAIVAQREPDAKLSLLRARSLELLGRRAEARKEAAQALALDPSIAKEVPPSLRP